VQEADGRYRFSVADNGIGINPKYYDQIFGIWESAWSRIPGNGIGLAIRKQIGAARPHLGRIRSREGSKFTLQFQLAERLPVR
jgi:signal transduction histidine kinase